MQLDNEKLIKSTNGLAPDELNMLRERFINDYARKKGWDKTNLSPNQMLEIVEQRGYKNPGIVFG